MTTKEKTRVSLLILATAILLVALITSVTDNLRKIIDNKNQISELEIYYEELLGDEESLQSEVTKLSDMDYLARYAKEKYLYSEKGEIIIRFE